VDVSRRVAPAKAGVHGVPRKTSSRDWIPACAEMTHGWVRGEPADQPVEGRSVFSVRGPAFASLLRMRSF